MKKKNWLNHLKQETSLNARKAKRKKKPINTKTYKFNITINITISTLKIDQTDNNQNCDKKIFISCISRLKCFENIG